MKNESWKAERNKAVMRSTMKLWGIRPQWELKIENTAHQGQEGGEDFTKKVTF